MGTVTRYPITDPTEHQERRKGLIGSSDKAVLFGLHKFTTIAQFTARLRGTTGLGPDPNSQLIKRGHALEAVGAAEAGKLHPTWTIEKCNTHFVDHDARTASSPDYMVIDPERSAKPAPLQIKVIAEPEWRKLEGAPAIAHLLQLSD